MSSIPQPLPKSTPLYLSLEAPSEWLACQATISGFGPNGTYITLKTDEVNVYLHAQYDQLIEVLEKLLADLKRAKPEHKQPRTMAQLAALPLTHPARVNFMARATPAQMLEFMQHCPALSPHLGEFQNVFNNQATTMGSDIALVEKFGLTPADILDELNQPRWGAQSRIGEALGIPNAGQANRERIARIIEIMQTRNSTTATKPPYIQPKEAIA